MKSFTDIYCSRHGLAPSEVPGHLFRQTLHPRARLIAGLLHRIYPQHFQADYEFIAQVGRLRKLPDISLALGRYLEHPANRGLLRQRWHLCISARRMLQIVRSVFDQTGPASPPVTLKRRPIESLGRCPTGPATGQCPGA